MASATKPRRAADNFDETFDVVVVGYGYSGGITALEAARNGARVLLIEKSAVPGGISICSYGAVRSANDAAKAYQYLTITNGGRTGDDVVRALADGMSEMEDYVRDLAKINDAEITTTEEYGKKGANYPLPGTEAFYHTTVVSVPNFSASAFYPAAIGAPGGPMLFKMVEDNLSSQRDNIEIRMETEAVRLISDGDEVHGLDHAAKTVCSRIRAQDGRRAGLRRLRRQRGDEGAVLAGQAGPAVRRAAAIPATASAWRRTLGAELWHMWHFHGAYGFKHPDPGLSLRASGSSACPTGCRAKRILADVKMAWILVDQNGRAVHERIPALCAGHLRIGRCTISIRRSRTTRASRPI